MTRQTVCHHWEHVHDVLDSLRLAAVRLQQTFLQSGSYLAHDLGTVEFVAQALPDSIPA